MTSPAAGVLREAAALVEGREPFVMVTVVWRRAPSSGQVGARALILADGSVRGWVGGACAEPTVVERARRSLETGESTLVFMGPPERAEGRGRSELESVPMACESDGALEVLLEPIIPPPRLVAIGRSPAVDAMAAMAQSLGWEAVVVDDGGRPDDHRDPAVVRTKLDLVPTVVDRRCAVVVATQGHYDDLALAAALATPAGYIGLVASPRRAAAVIEQLRSDGHDDEQLARIQAPAGLDLGPVANVEIAAAIVADLVRRRARGELPAGPDADRPAPSLATDPVCGMTVDPATARYHSLVDGVDHWFCASGCKRAFDADHGQR